MKKDAEKVAWGKIGRGAFRALCFHPMLWGTAMVIVFRLARKGWWKTPPFLPLPGAPYWRFRMVTAYGTSRAIPPKRDIVEFIAWARMERRSTLPHSL